MEYFPPKKIKQPVRNNRFSLRLSDDELAKLNAKAQEASLSSAVYLRDRILELSPPIIRVKDLPTINPSLMRKIAGIGNNINQLTKIANSQISAFGRADSTTLQLSIDRLANEIEQLREQYTAK